MGRGRPKVSSTRTAGISPPTGTSRRLSHQSWTRWLPRDSNFAGITLRAGLCAIARLAPAGSPPGPRQCPRQPVRQGAGEQPYAGQRAEAGRYATAALGKWGLQGSGAIPEAHPQYRGFDYFFGYQTHVNGHYHYPKEDGQTVWDGLTPTLPANWTNFTPPTYGPHGPRNGLWTSTPPIQPSPSSSTSPTTHLMRSWRFRRHPSPAGGAPSAVCNGPAPPAPCSIPPPA